MVKCRSGQARSNVEVSICLVGCLDQARDSCMPKLCQSATEGIDEDSMYLSKGANAKHDSIDNE